jgi:hypothetical protein
VSLAGLPANLLGLPLAGAPMLLGVIAAATAPVARWAASLPGGSVTLTGPARAVPAVLVALVVMAVKARRRSPY